MAPQSDHFLQTSKMRSPLVRDIAVVLLICLMMITEIRSYGLKGECCGQCDPFHFEKCSTGLQCRIEISIYDETPKKGTCQDCKYNHHEIKDASSCYSYSYN